MNSGPIESPRLLSTASEPSDSPRQADAADLDPPRQWIISQIGARQHYGVARGFAAINQFKRLYTDAWCPRPAARFLRKRSGAVRAFASRRHAEIPDDRVVRRNLAAIVNHYRTRQAESRSIQELHLEHLRVGERFDRAVARDLSHASRVDPLTDAFFGFNTGCLQTLQLMKELGVPSVLDQIDPAKVEEDLIVAESEKWPGWENIPGRIPREYWEHMSREWATADLILVNSRWTQSALIRQGVAPEKIRVIPVAHEPNVGPVPFPRQHEGPLNVLWLGSVILRKGIQYLIEAAKLLDPRRFHFTIAGSVGISPAAVATAPANMNFLGQVGRDRIDDLYRKADIFVLPTLSDGFAFTQVEALSKGLPVITTPNCGEVVTDGKEGRIVPICDARALADAMNQLEQDRALLREMSHNAFIRSTQFLMPTQAKQVEAEVQKLLRNRRENATIAAMSPPKRWIVAQIGNRDLYLGPVGFQRRGKLRLFFNDSWCSHFRGLVSRLPAPLWALARRYDPELPRNKVVAFTPAMMTREGWRMAWNRPKSIEAEYEMFLDIGAWFARRVAKHLSRIPLDPQLDAVLTYGSGGLEIMQQAHKRGVFSALIQLDPAETEQNLVLEEAKLWPGWASLPGTIPQSYFARLRAEWAEADVIFVCSEFTRQAVIEQGGAPEKVVVLPLAYEPEAKNVKPRTNRNDKPLDVLWVGQVVIRKGIQYLFEAARMLEKENVRFKVAGKIMISEMALKTAPSNLTMLGKVRREEAVELYNTCDLFVLPTTSDAFALTQLEAMSHGLPVIATPNSGDVVTPGVDGEIVPIRDPKALADAILKFVRDRNLLATMSVNAIEKSHQFTKERYHNTIESTAARLSAAPARG